MSVNGDLRSSGETGAVMRTEDERALVRTAFSAGWHMATLYIAASRQVAAPGRWSCPERSDGPPLELSAATVLGELDRARMVVDRVATALHALHGRFAAAGLQTIDLQAVRALVDAPPVDLASLCTALDTVHRAILISLTSVGWHLGAAYDLGRQLAYITQATEDRAAFERAFGPSLVSAKNVLADLASLLPDHASRAVVTSLRAWERWAADPRLDGRPLDWPHDLPAVRTALRRQGELWAALLSGEKLGEDMLRASDYVGAAAGLLGEAGQLGLRMLTRRPLLIAAATITLLLAAGIFLLVETKSGGKVAGALLAAAGAVGLTGAGARARAADAASGLQQKLWNAELDGAIAAAITIGPTNWGVDVGRDDVPGHGAVPRAGENLETLKAFREALVHRRRRRLMELLAPRVDIGSGERERAAIADELLQRPPDEMTAEPERLVAGRPGYLLAYHDGRVDVWRVQEGRVRLWRPFPVERQGAARAYAGLPPETGAEARAGDSPQPAPS